MEKNDGPTTAATTVKTLVKSITTAAAEDDTSVVRVKIKRP